MELGKLKANIERQIKLHTFNRKWDRECVLSIIRKNFKEAKKDEQK